MPIAIKLLLTFINPVVTTFEFRDCHDFDVFRMDPLLENELFEVG